MKIFLLRCGLLSSLYYVLINIFVPLRFEGYSYAEHTPSELSAIDAPTRALWLWLVSVYILLFAGFSIGVWKSSQQNRSLRFVAYVMFAYTVVNVYWPLMHLRGNVPTLTDTLHIVWAMMTVLLMILMMCLGALALGRKFLWYTIFSIVTHFVFGLLTSLEAPNIPLNGPTPTIGVWERINIAVFMIWIGVLSVALIRNEAHEQSSKGVKSAVATSS